MRKEAAAVLSGDVLGRVIDEVVEAAASADGRDAARLLADRIREDRSLLDEFPEDHLVHACRLVIADRMVEERRGIIASMKRNAPAVVSSDGGLAARIAANGLGEFTRSLMFRLPLPGRPRLGEATAEQMEQCATQYRGWARGDRVKARWLEGVAREKRKGTALTDALVATLYRRAERAEK